MCGRFTLFISPDKLAVHFRLNGAVDYAPRYNIAPTQTIPCIIHDVKGKRVMRLFRWGLIPHWSDDASIGSRLINARSETMRTKPSFRSAFKHFRCLIPTTGFFEWKREGTRKRPHFIGMKDGDPFAFAGIWERWADPEGNTVETCAILTTSANDLVGTIHDRMPVILHPEDYDRWLDPAIPAESLEALLVPYPADLMATREVSNMVNNARCDAPECIQAVD
ncbi:MAG: SOS response-associated peptidase [Candidatus Latescibacterota bacterium]